MRIARLALAAGLALLPSLVWAQDRAVVVATCGTAPHTYTAGQIQPFTVNTDGQTCSTGGAGGGGDASAANQTSQITQETAIAGGVGTAADAAATQGSTGSLSAKLRTVTSQLNTLDGRVDGIEALIGSTNTAIAALPQNNTLAAGTTGGCTPDSKLSAATNNATNIKGSAGTLCSLSVFNTNDAVTKYYLKLYDKATAPTCGTDTPVQRIMVPGAATGGGGAVINLSTYGHAYTLGIGFCLVAGLADNDNTSAVTGILINYSYK